MIGSHGRKWLPKKSIARANNPISIENWTKQKMTWEKTSVSLENATFRTRPAFAVIEAIPKFVVKVRKPHGKIPHSK
jgi:hypothetical protein